MEKDFLNYYNYKVGEEPCVINIGMEAQRSNQGRKNHGPIGHQNLPGTNFDFGVLGCSVSWGYAYGKHYASLLEREGHRVLNAAVIGAGFDSIYINLKYILDRFSFKKIIILSPNFERKIYKYQSAYGTRCLIPITVHRKEPIYHKTVSDLCSPRIITYSKIFFHKIVKLCEHHDLKLFVSSWDRTVMNWLQNHKNRKFDLLPYFEMIDYGEEMHPGIKSHQIWYDQIKDIIINP